MKVTRKDQEGIAVLRLEGEFDSFETEEVRENFEACVQKGQPYVVMDLKDMTFANSTTIAYLISAQRKAQSLGGRVILARPGDFFLKTLKTLGLDQVFSISTSVDDAVTAMK